MAGQMSSSPGKRREMDLMKLYSPAQHNHPVSLRPSATTQPLFRRATTACAQEEHAIVYAPE